MPSSYGEREPLLSAGSSSSDVRQRRRVGAADGQAHYGGVSEAEADGADAGGSGDGPAFIPEQFRRRSDLRPAPVPWKSVLLGAFLLLCGSFALSMLAYDLYLGYEEEEREEEEFREKWKHVDDESYFKPAFVRRSERFWPLCFLGFVSFVPGAYVVAIAVLAACGVEGFSFEDIP